MTEPTSKDDQLSQLLEESMKFIGFKYELLSPACVEGRFVVSERSVQPFRVLHGGVSALIAETLASVGAYIACGFQRVAGIQLQINHLKAAPIGTEVYASAKPAHVGEKLHIWDVTLSKVDDSAKSVSEQNPGGTKIAVSRVTIMVGLSGQAKEFDRFVKANARL